MPSPFRKPSLGPVSAAINHKMAGKGFQPHQSKPHPDEQDCNRSKIPRLRVQLEKYATSENVKRLFRELESRRCRRHQCDTRSAQFDPVILVGRTYGRIVTTEAAGVGRRPDMKFSVVSP
jgi:hypothetical protein